MSDSTKRRRWTEDAVKKVLEEDGYSLISKFDTVQKKIEITCPNGHILLTAFHTFRNGRRCADCGEKDVLVLEFDHVRGSKVECVSVLVAKSAPLHTVKGELSKCEVVCANCHRRRTYLRQTNNWRVKRLAAKGAA